MAASGQHIFKVGSDAPHIQSVVVKAGEKAAALIPITRVSLCPAKGRSKRGVIVRLSFGGESRHRIASSSIEEIQRRRMGSCSLRCCRFKREINGPRFLRRRRALLRNVVLVHKVFEGVKTALSYRRQQCISIPAAEWVSCHSSIS